MLSYKAAAVDKMSTILYEFDTIWLVNKDYYVHILIMTKIWIDDK